MLKISYLALSAIIFGIVVLGYRKHLKNSGATTKGATILTILLSSWLIYLALLSYSEVLQSLELPPRFPLLVFVPIILLSLIFWIRNKTNSNVLSIPITWTVHFQSFRVFVELILLYTFYTGIIPKSATFEGFNFDIIMGISAPFMAYFIFKNNRFRFLQYTWNILGILMILFVGFIIATSMYRPDIWGSETPLVSLDFVSTPYLLLAGFLAPMGIFMHIVTLLILKKGNQLN